ncbi:MAG: CBS domain-containing protein [Candidatus Korarchaeota archaeon]|nr:CBS domain-containing protein [Candidatus Korarchaeota archaeon]
MSLTVQEIMIKDVITLGARATVSEAVKLMNENKIGCLVVIHNENPIGIITERDMLKRVLLEARDPDTTKVSQIMTTPLVVGNPRMDIQEAVSLMTGEKIKKLPITEDGKLVGMITLTDLARSIAYLEHLFKRMRNGTPTG